jgi:glycosyltransferase involved in cell wall biosynthesis
LGLSILIPVYNYPVEELVKDLSSQLKDLDIPSEIIILDDGSTDGSLNTNKQLSAIDHVQFHANETNMGRMAARIKLANLANDEYLLFLDADSKLTKKDFLKTYLQLINEKVILASGGRIYNHQPPACTYKLHWLYGSRRESTVHNKPAFMSNNFLVKKDIFMKLDHRVKLDGYGHEDTLWGMQFEKMGIHYRTINNPVIHNALENAEQFLSKSEQALRNLVRLAEENTDDSLLKKHVKIYRAYKKLKTTGMLGIFLAFEKTMEKKIKTNLVSCEPNLRYFDWYRLAYLSRLMKEIKK